MLKPIVLKKLNGSKLKIAVIQAKFNEKITDNLLSGCLKALEYNNVKNNNIKIFEVSGAFELPLMAKKLASKFDVVICLGAVIRGGTPHFDYVCSESARGIMDVTLQTQKPIIFGVITCDNLKQAIERSSNSTKNKGWQAGVAGVEMGSIKF
ncbi:MAG: 6,7-dimethyl-8-ribityllumazine synthase [bacterium]